MHPPVISIVIRGSKKPIKHGKLELHITYIVRIMLWCVLVYVVRLVVIAIDCGSSQILGIMGASKQKRNGQ